jgi:hypothetical protein
MRETKNKFEEIMTPNLVNFRKHIDTNTKRLGAPHKVN